MTVSYGKLAENWIEIKQLLRERKRNWSDMDSFNYYDLIRNLEAMGSVYLRYKTVLWRLKAVVLKTSMFMLHENLVFACVKILVVTASNL